MTGKIPTQARKPAGATPQRQTSPFRRILVVEGDRYIRQTNAMVLHHAGYHVDTAEDGASGWKALSASRYDVLITDNIMPGVTGMEMIKKLRSEEMPPAVIMASGTAPTEELDRNPWLRLDAILLKPYTPKAMLDAVKEVLSETESCQVSGSRETKADKIPQAGEQVGAVPQSQANPPLRILVVDDDPDIRRLNAEALSSSGYKVDTAEDGKAGWKAVSYSPESYALLITDHSMPGLTGLALVKKVRAAHLALPVIMATGALPEEDLFDRYPWLQPAAALIKPYSVDQLLGAVRKFLHAPDGERGPIGEGGSQ